MRTVLQFPTFVMRDPTIALEQIEPLAARLREGVHRARECAPELLETDALFACPDRLTLAHDLRAARRAHVAALVEGVAIAAWCSPDRHRVDAVVPYSMGLYAALVYANAVPFEEALLLMLDACRIAHEVSGPGPYAMAALSGMTRAEIMQTAADAGVDIEITERFTRNTMLITGREHAVADLVSAAAARGWADTSHWPVSAPFHSATLRAAEPLVRARLARVAVTAPSVPIRSSTAPAWITSASDVRDEIVRNVWSPMDWLDSVRDVATRDARGEAHHDATHFIECGRSRRLSAVVQRDLGEPHTAWTPADSTPTAND